MQLPTTQQTLINPRQWQEKLGYSQAVEMRASISTIYLSRQAAMNAESNPQALDMQGRLQACLYTLETELAQAGSKIKYLV